MVISNSLNFVTNGNQQSVKLVAWGWDAHFYKNKNLTGNNTFDSLKPHVVYGFLRVDTASSLTIQAGSKIYFHKDAYLVASYQSSLKVEGERQHPVRFQGDRLDPFYRDLPGQWAGIYLEDGSKEHVINYAIIKNGFNGIGIGTTTETAVPMLKLDNTIIQNETGQGIYATGSYIKSTNCVIGDCGGSSVALVYGGNYEFIQLTIGNNWSSSVRSDTALYLSNYYYDDNGVKQVKPMTKATFENIILDGNRESEFGFDVDPSVSFNYLFDHCLLKTRKNIGDVNHYNTCLTNQDPLFVNPSLFDYRIDSNSPAIRKGILNNDAMFDIRGVYRGPVPDLGAYQYVSNQ